MRPGVHGAISHWHFRCPQGTGAASRERNTNTGSEREPSLLNSPPAQPRGGAAPQGAGGLLLAPTAGQGRRFQGEDHGSASQVSGRGLHLRSLKAHDGVSASFLAQGTYSPPDLSGLSREPDKITDVTAGSEVQTCDCRCGSSFAYGVLGKQLANQYS